MKKKMFWNGLLAGGMILMMSAAAFAGETEMPEEANDVEVVYEYDENGWVSAERYFNANGERVTLEDGTSGYTQINLTENWAADQTFLDENDEPVMNTEKGYARVTRDTDENGNVILVCFYDAEGNLVVTPAGYAVVARAYNEDGKKVQEAYFDADENPIALPDKEYAGYFSEYDEDGKETRTYVAPDGTVLAE